MLSRRGLLLGVGGTLITAPAIVRASSLMPVRLPKGMEFTDDAWFAVTQRNGITVIRYKSQIVCRTLGYIKNDPYTVHEFLPRAMKRCSHD